MGSYGDCRTIEVDAPPERCFALMTDYERMPSWQGALRSVRVLERDDQGRGSVVSYEVDARLKVVRYRLRQVYDEPNRLASEYLGGDFRDFSGEWRFLPAGEGRTHVELDLRIDPGRFVPGALRGAIADAVMKRALRDLKREAETHGVPAS
jgi:ribosome-associated toxin RatA of RatAB toxin-antitoxin module